jgi:hypothetical protein
MYCLLKEGESGTIYELGLVGGAQDRYVDVSEEVVRKIVTLAEAIDIMCGITLSIQPFRTDMEPVVRRLDTDEISRLISVINTIMTPEIQALGFVFCQQESGLGQPLLLRKSRPK